MAGALLLLALPVVADTPPPDPALLEFLADWDDGHGGIVDWEMLVTDAADEGPRQAAPARNDAENADVVR